jgi:tetratricopeptide (TPR) repeat protein
VFSNRLLFPAAILFVFAATFSPVAEGATVLVLQFHNSSQYSDLNWVGESISETLKDEFSGHSQIVFGRDLRAEALNRLSLRPGADFTKATLIRLGRSVDADYVYYGTYDASLPPGSSALKDSSIHVSAHVIDLRKLHDGPDVAEAGKLVDLTRLEEHLAWQSLRYLDSTFNLPLENFLTAGKTRRADAEESYVRGLLSSSKDQQQKWFAQALALDPHFANPAYELGKLALEHKDFRQAIAWFQRISATDPHYPEARFEMGLAAYGASDYGASASYFREIIKTFPLNEVYNNLGAAENRLDQLSAADDFRHALEGDPNDPVYLFNLGNALLKHSNFDEAEKRFQAVLEHDPNDAEARTLLGQAQRHEFAGGSTGKPPAPDRLKSNFELTAFRQLKAVVQGKSSP